MPHHLDSFVTAAKARAGAGAYDLVGTPLAPNGSLAATLHVGAIIAELKPRSPSEGRLLSGPASEKLSQYVLGGAAGISCLADSDHFDGSPDLVREAHSTGLPILWKDFVIDAKQVRAAAHHGASAVLLIERILKPAQRDELIALANSLGLESLLEIGPGDEWEAAAQSNATMIGVNARNLDTLEMEPDVAREMMRCVSSSGRHVVALSGIANRSDRLAAETAGAKGTLVGTSLMRAPDAATVLRALRRPVAKTCGLSTEDDVDAAAAAGADLVGFVVGTPNSPRNISALRAQQLGDRARQAGMRTVVVTSHADAYEVREWCRLAKPDYLQAHGFEPSEEWSHSLGAIPTQVLRVVKPGSPLPDGPCILDASKGTGTGHDWPAGSADAAHLTLIAGGLDASNVAEALQRTGAWGTDASSSLETAPGVKDPQRIASFVEACHGA